MKNNFNSNNIKSGAFSFMFLGCCGSMVVLKHLRLNKIIFNFFKEKSYEKNTVFTMLSLNLVLASYSVGQTVSISDQIKQKSMLCF